MQTEARRSTLPAEPGLATPVVADRLFRIGCEVPGRDLTWLADDAALVEPLNAFLFLSPEHAVLLDTAPRIAQTAIGNALSQLVGHRTVAVFPSRNEPDCIGNLGLVLSLWPTARLLFGGGGGILEWVAEPGTEKWSTQGFLGRTEIVHAPNGSTFRLDADCCFHWLDAPVKQMFLTQWAYEETTKTLFSSDFFGWCHLGSGRSPVVTDVDQLPSVEQIAAEVVLRFNWLPGADCPEVLSAYDDVVARWDIDHVAPVHGCVVSGAETVSELFARTRAALVCVTRNES